MSEVAAARGRLGRRAGPPAVPAHGAAERAAARDPGRGARAIDDERLELVTHHRGRRRRRPEPGHRLLRLAGRARPATPRSSRRSASTASAAGGDRRARSAPSKTPEPRLPARRGDPRSARSASSDDPARRPRAHRPTRRRARRSASRRSRPRRRSMADAWRTADVRTAWLRRRQAGRRDEPRRGGHVPAPASANAQVGHAGTLDPDATGVLLVGVGQVTRLLRFLDGADKTYTGEVVLGRRDVDARRRRRGDRHARHGRRDRRRRPARGRRRHSPAPSMQVPPMVSAVKVGGRRLHELAREGIEVERAAAAGDGPPFDVEPTDDPGRAAIDVDVLVGHLRALAGRRPRAAARRRRPPAQPAPHRGRLVHERRGPPARRRRAPAAGRRRCATTRAVDRRRPTVGHGSPHGRPLLGASTAPGRGPCRLDGDGSSARGVRGAPGAARPSPAVVLPCRGPTE